MKYLILIYEDEAQMAARSPDKQQQVFADYGAYTQELVAAGVMVSGEALQPSVTASSVRVRGGEALFTDGPFAETREQLGGFYLIDCADLDEALQWAAKCPTSRDGTIEVRPLLVWET